jgi:hypothetical protein
MSRLSFGTPYHHSCQNILPFYLLPKPIKSKVYKTVTFGLGFTCVKLTSQIDGITEMGFKNRVLRNIFGDKKEKIA